MLLFSVSPLLGSLGILGFALGACFVLLVMVRSARHVPRPDAIEDLTYRLRHPVQHALAHPWKTIQRKVGR